jgi:hypothetical protein
MSVSLTHACRYCYKDAESACGYCHSSFYCSRECQKKDWDQHRQFCMKDETPALAIKRRDLCLKLIGQSENIAFQFLMQQKLAAEKRGFLFVNEESGPLYFQVAPIEVFHNVDIPINEKTYAELQAEIERSDTEPRMIVLYTDDETTTVYVMNSKEFGEVHRSVDMLPQPLLRQIFRIFYFNTVALKSVPTSPQFYQRLDYMCRTGKAPWLNDSKV